MWEAWAGGIAACIVIAGAAVGALRWLILHEILTELRPNGGQSFRDHVDRRLDTQDVRLVDLSERLSIVERRLKRD